MSESTLLLAVVSDRLRGESDDLYPKPWDPPPKPPATDEEIALGRAALAASGPRPREPKEG